MQRFTLGGTFTPGAGPWRLGAITGIVDGPVTTRFAVIDQFHAEPHNGTDIAPLEGTPIFAPPLDGVVSQVGMVKWAGPGNKVLFEGTPFEKVLQPGDPDRGGVIVLLMHEGPFLLPDGRVVARAATLYCHLREEPAFLWPGKVVRGGDLLGYVGSTGYSTGPHLHVAVAFARPGQTWWPPDMSDLANVEDALLYVGAPGGEVVEAPPPPLPVAQPLMLSPVDWGRMMPRILGVPDPRVLITPAAPTRAGWDTWILEIERNG